MNPFDILTDTLRVKRELIRDKVLLPSANSQARLEAIGVIDNIIANVHSLGIAADNDRRNTGVLSYFNLI